MSKATKEPTLSELKKEIAQLLIEVNFSLAGLLVEHKGEQRRALDARDFGLNEVKRLAIAIERLTAQLEKHK